MNPPDIRDLPNLIATSFMRTRPLADHLILILGCGFMMGPVLLLVLASLNIGAILGPGGLDRNSWAALFEPYNQVLFTEDLFGNGVDGTGMLINSVIVAGGIAILKTGLSLLAAFALVCFRLRGATFLFGLILLPMFFPIETRILPTFIVTDDLGLLNSYSGMILPIVATGLGTLVFRQFLRQIPGELFEAAQLDGAGPIRFLVDILIPLALPMIAALFAMLFVLGWNQYLWPLMINTTAEEYYTIVRGIQRAGTGSSTGMALGVLAMLPPVAVMLVAQKWILRGLAQALQ
jgi:sn-glycerol 3-phosphate transport system permease protein